MPNLTRFFLLAHALIFSMDTWGQVKPSGVLYELKDLAVLEREKNFEEFLLHVSDIRPSERMKLWKDMYQSMAMEMIDYKLKTKDLSMKTFKRIEEIGRSSALGNDEFFQLKRAIYAKKFFSECYSTATLLDSNKKDQALKICDNELNSFWYFSKKDPDIGLELATLIQKYPSNLTVWPFYQNAINDVVAPVYCEKPDVQRVVIAKLTSESLLPDFDGNYKNLIRRLVPEKCFNKMTPTLRVCLKSNLTSALDKERAMILLEASGNLTAQEEDLYALIYLLDGPVVGEKMNMAWKKIEALGEQYKKRLALLEQVKGLLQMPDKIFKDPSLPRHKAIINLFAKNFPEYLNHYAESCLTYLENKSETPVNISGSQECHEFLSAARELKKSENKDWVSDTISTQYSSLKK